tara:strand:+ start:307 stop:567 length:261 start_codon:yes stop_codon:yes gene_type:complete
VKITKARLRQIIRESLEQRAAFITDFGAPIPIEQEGDALELDFTSLPRYAVWGDTGRGKPQVIDNGDDLQSLLAKYGLTPDKVRQI